MDTYRDYFRHQAEAHPLLNHTEEDKVFGMISIEESFGDFRGDVQTKGWILRLLDYSYRPVLSESGEWLKRYQGGWIVAKYYDEVNGGEPDRLAAQDAAENVTDQIIAKIIADSNNGHPLWDRSLDAGGQFNSQLVTTTGDMCYIGWRTVFTWDNLWRDCIPSPTADPEWDDGGLTPFEL